MPEVEVEVDAEQLKKKIKKLREKLPDTKKELINTAAEFGYKKMKDYAPEDTGTLKDSITKEVSENRFTIEVGVDYAEDVEYPTRASKGGFVPYPGLKSQKERYEERGARGKKGRHPGTKGKWFRKKTREDLSDEIPELAGRHLTKLVSEAEDV